MPDQSEKDYNKKCRTVHKNEGNHAVPEIPRIRKGGGGGVPDLVTVLYDCTRLFFIKLGVVSESAV